MFLGYQNNKIKFYTEQPLDKELYNLDKIEETDQEYVFDGTEYVLKDSAWEEEQTLKRKALFENEFMETSYTYEVSGIVVDTTLENVTVDKDTFGAKVENAGTYEFDYAEGQWTLNGETVSLAEYGITAEVEEPEQPTEQNEEPEQSSEQNEESEQPSEESNEDPEPEPAGPEATIIVVYSKETLNAWYRQVPNGYSNAPQSIDIINNMVGYQGSLKAEIAAMIKFYKKPDYTKPEQCTEAWLVANSFSPSTMTKTEWKNFYIDFQSRWAVLNYQRQLQTIA